MTNQEGREQQTEKRPYSYSVRRFPDKTPKPAEIEALMRTWRRDERRV